MNRSGLKPSLPEGIKVLSEEEIRNRLYGEYLKSSRAEKPSCAPSPSVSSSEPIWTGAQILSAELKQLRSELISLRQEQEALSRRLKPDGQSSRAVSQAVEEGGSWFETVVGLIVFSLGFMGPLSFKLLQASPQVVAGEATPYTVQVAVYDVKAMAHQALSRLTQMGYPAFLTELPKRNGKLRYRLYTGRFVTREEAEKQRQQLRLDPKFAAFQDAFVRLR